MSETTKAATPDDLFERWWESDGQSIDPDTDDVPWFDKRKGLAGSAYVAGYAALEERLRECEALLKTAFNEDMPLWVMHEIDAYFQRSEGK